MNKINLLDKFDLFNEHWTPKIIGDLNGQQVKIVKVQGEFVWYDHANEDELFMIIKGQLIIHLENESVELNEGELSIVPRGIQHKPEAKEECWILLFEPKQITHTGDAENDLTRNKKEWI